MLNVMRENLRSLRWVLWVVAASMVLYLGAFFSCDDQAPGQVAGDWAARVDGSPISAARFRQAARGLDEQYRSTFGEQYEGLRPSLRIGSQVINSLIVEELVRRDAQRIGLTVGDAELADTIRNDPQLQQDGVFVGKELYEQVLERNYPGGVTAFEEAVAADLILQKWYDLMTQSVHVGDAELEELHRRRTEKTAIDYVIVATADQEIETKIEDAELQAWYQDRPEEYRREPGRLVRTISLDRDRLADTVGVTEAEISASYEANRQSYAHGDQRRASHILLRIDPAGDEAAKAEVRTRAETILSRLQSGESFESLAQTLSEDPISAARGGDLDFFERERMVTEFSDAVFATPVGELAPLTETQFGFHVIRVTDARPAGTTPLEQVRDEIEARLKARRTQEKVAAEAERVSARLQGGETLDAVAADESLEIQEQFVSRDDPASVLGAVRPDALTQVFDLAVGETSTPLDTRSGKLLVQVKEVKDAEIAPLDEVENEVRTDLLNARMRDKAVETARQATSGDWDFDATARALGLDVQDSGDLPPGNAPTGSGGTSEELEAALFGDTVAVGDQGVVPVPGGALIYRVSRREPFDPDAFAAARPALLNEVETNRESALRESILTKLRDRYEVEINQTLVGQIDGMR